MSLGVPAFKLISQCLLEVGEFVGSIILMFHLFSQLSHFCHKIPHFTISGYTTFLPPFRQRGIFL